MANFEATDDDRNLHEGRVATGQRLAKIWGTAKLRDKIDQTEQDIEDSYNLLRLFGGECSVYDDNNHTIERNTEPESGREAALLPLMAAVIMTSRQEVDEDDRAASASRLATKVALACLQERTCCYGALIAHQQDLLQGYELELDCRQATEHWKEGE